MSHSRVFRRRLSAILAAIFWITPHAAVAQETNRDPFAEIQRLRSAGDLGAAAQLLRTQLALNPDNAEAARLLAQTLYWLKDHSGARAVYDAAINRHPGNTVLRLEYARMLAEIGEHARARELVTSLLGSPAARADAATLLGTLSYWEGDLTAARGRFEEALGANPNQQDAKRQLQEILSGTVSWARLSSSVWHDNQPIVRPSFGAEAGWFATPLMQVITRVESRWYRLNGSSRPVQLAEIAVAHYEPRSRMESEVSLGAVRRARAADSWDWSGRLVAAFRLPKHFKIGARIERTPYFSTKASLESAVTVRTAGAVVHWGNDRGWLGEAHYQYHWYPDGNAGRDASGWMLAPIVHRSRVDLQAGYALALGNAVAGRFVLAAPQQAVPPGDPRFSTAGRYAPYYTPDHLITHSVLAGLGLGRPHKSFRFDASYGVHASDNAPFLYVSGSQVARGTYPRVFSPWNVRTSCEIPIRGNLILEPAAEAGRTIFYSWTSAGLRLLYRFDK
jgi:tetratricopeptide (TPR) repeat protein